jgi:putative methionine-R-sulfoxide reductase with GAF domain
VPITSGARVLGEIDIDSDQPAAFRSNDKQLLESVASLLAPVLEGAY